MDWIKEYASWIQAAFSGIGVSAIDKILKFFGCKRKEEGTKMQQQAGRDAVNINTGKEVHYDASQKNEIIQQSCDNSTNIEIGRDVQVNINISDNHGKNRTSDNIKENLISILQTSYNNEDRQKNAIIQSAIQVIPQLSQAHINYLSFVFCILGVQFDYKTRQDVIRKLQSLLLPFYSYDFFKEDFLTMLQYTACLSPMPGGDKYCDLGVYFIRKSPHIFAYNFSNESRNFIHAHSFLNDVIECDSRNPNQFTVSMTRGQLVSEFDKQGYPWEDGALFFYLLGKSCPDEQKTSFIQEIGPEVWRFAEKWNNAAYHYSALELSPLGKAIALFNCKTKIKDFEEIEFTI